MGTFRHRITEKENYLFVWQEGAATMADILRLQEDLERSVKKTGFRCLLTDNRDLSPPPEEVRNCMIEWLDRPGAFEAVAILVRSPMLVVRINMDSLAKRARRRGFSELGAAEDWIQAIASRTAKHNVP